MNTENQYLSDREVLNKFVLNAVYSITSPINMKQNISTYRHQLLEKDGFKNGYISILEISNSLHTYTQMTYVESFSTSSSESTMVTGADRILFKTETGEIVAQEFTSGMNDIIYNETADKTKRIHKATNYKHLR